MNDTFNWFEEELEFDIEDYQQKETSNPVFVLVFDQICSRSNQVFIFLLSIRLMRLLFGFNSYKISDVDFNLILNSFIFLLGSLAIIVASFRTLTYVLLNLDQSSKLEPFLALHRFFSIIVWCIFNLYWIKSIKSKIPDQYIPIRNTLLSFMITAIAFSISSVLMVWFDKYFLSKTLSAKLSEVKKTEKIISAMKNYRYEISSSGSESTPQCTCKDVFCFAESNNFANEDSERRGLADVDVKKSYLRVPQPELHSISDAKTLARDIFYKASSDSNTLSFDDFTSIFHTTQSGINSFPYFDNGTDKNISKKTFHDTILLFYMERVNLEKSIHRAEEFVEIVGNILNIIFLIVLCLIYLVIFGIPLSELLALALSSALALNFLASGMASDLYYNFMMLLSHQFDIGDEVIIENTEYRVHEFALTSTSVIGENGGKVKFMNSDLWNKKLINMTRAPEKILVFKFTLNPDISTEEFVHFKSRIHNYLRHKKFDFFDSFSLQSISETKTGIDQLDCCLILKCKNFKNKSKKFVLRVEVTSWLRNTIEEMGIGN